MAQHDFAPAWLNFPTPPSSTRTLGFFTLCHKHDPQCSFSVLEQKIQLLLC
nr:PREDICTED: vasculin-like [Haliaeetus albicilla]